MTKQKQYEKEERKQEQLQLDEPKASGFLPINKRRFVRTRVSPNNNKNRGSLAKHKNLWVHLGKQRNRNAKSKHRQKTKQKHYEKQERKQQQLQFDESKASGSLPKRG